MSAAACGSDDPAAPVVSDDTTADAATDDTGDDTDQGDAATDDTAEDPYAAWPDPKTVFPWGAIAPDPDKPAWADARWETESWGMEDATIIEYATKTLQHYQTTSPDIASHFAKTGAEIPPLGDGLVISLAGDILWVGDNWTAFGAGAAPVTEADLRIANLEMATSAEHEVQRTGVPVRFNGPPELLDHLPFDVLQLNNNHSVDMGDDGALSTKAEVEKRGFVTTGHGEHATVDVKGKKVALLSYTWGVNRRDYTTALELFVVPFGHTDGPVDLGIVEAQVAAARADGADHVVVLLHWGYEFEWFPAQHFLQLSRQMVSFGADVVAGEGPHVVQPAELCWVNHPEKVPGVGTCSVRSADGKPRRAAILYSLGNFTNDIEDRIEVETGIVAKVSLDGDVTGLGWTPIVLRQDPVRVEPAEAHLSDPEVAGEIARLEKHLGAGWRLPAPLPKDPEEEALLTIDETESWTLPGLTGPAYVVRTEANVPHVYARTREDLGRVLGFTLARDRFFFMELQRRYSLGTIAGLLGDAGLSNDMNARLTGVSMVADRLTDAVRGDMKLYLEAFVDGVNAYIAAVKAGKIKGPSELDIAAPLLGAENPTDLLTPFTLRDVLAISAALLFETNFRMDDVERSRKLAALDGAFDGVDASALREAGFLGDIWGQFRPLAPGNASAPGFGTSGLDQVVTDDTTTAAVPKHIEKGLLNRIAARTAELQRGITHEAFGAYGSNAWAVAGSKTETGGALVAGDGHLSLSVPSLMYQVGMDTRALGKGSIHQLGSFLTPFPILGVGTNGEVAWSMVNPVVDVTDWYREEVQLTAGLPSASKFQGEWKALKAIEETYVIADVPVLGSVGRTEKWLRYETFDGRRLLDIEGTPVPEDAAPSGPIVHLGATRIVPGDVDGDGVVTAVTFDFSAFDAKHWPEGLFNMGVAGDVLDYRDATRAIVGGGLFMAAGDKLGNVFYSSYQAIPCRGYLPRDGATFEPGAHPAYLLDGTRFGGFTIPTDDDGHADEA
ncbi:MAG: penicillin acylase family protein, partial [Myxococcales bacterium]|nr:penicillin acylase family protein [Myxococcales bacterium]